MTIWYFLPASQKQHISYTAPVPDFLSLHHNQQVRLLDLWLPIIQTTKVSAQEEYTARSILVYDMTMNKTLFTKNTSEEVPMASLTKIMTAIIALENQQKDDRYTVIPADIVGEDSMGLTAGEVLSLHELLYGLFLNSGNDAAETIASNYPSGRGAFITAMNEKAIAFGLTHTHFTNPTGLQGDGNQHTTAYDLLVMTRYLLDKYPQILSITSSYTYDIPQTQTHKEYYLINETNLISSYPGVKGLKTGYTPEAGLCLVTYLASGGHTIVAILLGSQDRRDEMKRLLDYSLQSEGIPPPLHE